MKTSSELLIYIPTYNHSLTIYNLLNDLKLVNMNFDVLILDDSSVDNTLEKVKLFTEQKKPEFNINLVKTKKNYGYAASQKIAYTIFLEKTNCKKIIMLHGDGQYEAVLINKFRNFTNNNYDVVQGYRDKITFNLGDETSNFAYYTIKILTFYENLVLGTNFKEWHSGFVMYSRDFLNKIPFNNLVNHPHIDGNILYIAKLLKTNVESVKIYKKYSYLNNYNYFKMIAYGIYILYIPFIFLFKNKKFLRGSKKINYKYQFISL